MTVDRSGWPPGPWDGEPDFDVWREPQTNLLCAMVRHPHYGSLCGYVRIPKVCPLHGSAREHVDGLVTTHGDITFAGMHDMLAPGFWVGFDTGHGFDVQPAMLDIYERLNAIGPPHAHYRCWAYVRATVEQLACDLAALPKDAL